MGVIDRLHQAKGHTLVMGILNVTPDSFYAESRAPSPEEAIRSGVGMVKAGADLIDVGGESTRPGSNPVPVEEEIERVVPVVEALAERVSVPVSVDTRRASTARAALKAGASVVNDTSAGRDDPEILGVVAEHGADVVLMHRQGSPDVMQEDPSYDAVVPEVTRFFGERVQTALDVGVERSSVVVDPGIGFGKGLDHNLALIQACKAWEALGFAVLVGVSRKSMFEALLGRGVEDRLAGSLAVAAHAAMGGVHALRVHDVEATVDVVKTVDALEGDP